MCENVTQLFWIFQKIFGKITIKKDIKKTKQPKRFFLKLSVVFLSTTYKKNKLNKKYTAAYFARNANPKNKPNKKKFINNPLSLMCNNCAKDRVQNNNNNKSVEIKKEDRVAAGITKKLAEQSKESFLFKERDKQSL